VTQIIDNSVVEELIALGDGGDPELLLDLIEIFLADGPVKVQEIVEGLSEGDFERMERAAHSLKGSSGNLGARELQAVCEQFQVASRQHRLDEIQDLSPALLTAYEQAEKALLEIRATYA